MLRAIEGTFERFGFLPLMTPALEYLDILTGKYGDEGDTLLYRFQDQGGRDVALRYDLTVPLARAVAQYPEIKLPFRRYQIAPVWRAEKPARGRFREFVQCDGDIVGSADMAADAEVVLLACELLDSLGVKGFVVRFNNRKVLSGLMEMIGVGDGSRPAAARAPGDAAPGEAARGEAAPADAAPGEAAPRDAVPRDGVPRDGVPRDAAGKAAREAAILRAVDKLPKIGAEEVERILREDCGLAEEQVSAIRGFLALGGGSGTDEGVRRGAGESAPALLERLKGFFQGNETGLRGVAELEEVVSIVRAVGLLDRIECDLSIARGLNYYTGTIYEAFLTDLPDYGAVMGGGRYDELIGIFKGEAIPGVGISLGIDRLLEGLIEIGLLQECASVAGVCVTVFDASTAPYSARVARTLRLSGVACECFPAYQKMGKQFRHAERAGIRWVVIAGSDEESRASVSVKDLESGKQEMVPLDGLADYLTARGVPAVPGAIGAS